MRVGVELMMTNISAAKSSLRPSKITHGTLMRRGLGRVLLQVELQRSEPVLAVDDQVAGASAPGGCRPCRCWSRLEAQRLGREQQDVPGIGGWLTAIS